LNKSEYLIDKCWKGFADKLPDKEREIFTKMLNDCHKYSEAINVKGAPFPTEPVIMAPFIYPA